MNVYETTLGNSTIYITRHSPDQPGFPATPGFAQTDLTIFGDINPGANASLITSVDQEIRSIVTSLVVD